MVVNALIESKRKALEALCTNHHVRRLDLFGSAARTDFDPDRSDIDFIVEFDDKVRRGFSGDYFQLMNQLELLLGRPVDLVERKAIRNPYFLEQVEETGVRLYGI